MDTKELQHNVNGIANLTMAAALIAATIIGCIAIFLQPWLWWQIGLAICAVIGIWGLILAAVAAGIR